MLLTLKNGENIKLEWNYLVLEYLEEREGSIESLEDRIKDFKSTEQMRITNSFVYAVIQANYDDLLTYKQAIRLIKMDDYPKVFRFIQKQLEIQSSYKKKGTSKKNGNHHPKEMKKSTGQK